MKNLLFISVLFITTASNCFALGGVIYSDSPGEETSNNRGMISGLGLSVTGLGLAATGYGTAALLYIVDGDVYGLNIDNPIVQERLKVINLKIENNEELNEDEEFLFQVGYGASQIDPYANIISH